MNQKKRFNFLNYLPTLKEAKWWIITGIIWAIISPPIVTSPPLRESIRLGMDNSMTFLVVMLPIIWAGFLLQISSVMPYALGSSEGLIPSLLLGAVLGGFAGYLLLIVLRPLLKLYSKYYRP